MSRQRALVTGGSGSIGCEIVKVFAEAGADVAIHYAPEADMAFGQPSAAEDAVLYIRERGGRALAVAAGFALPGEAIRCVAAAEDALGGVESS